MVRPPRPADEGASKNVFKVALFKMIFRLHVPSIGGFCVGGSVDGKDEEKERDAQSATSAPLSNVQNSKYRRRGEVHSILVDSSMGA